MCGPQIQVVLFEFRRRRRKKKHKTGSKKEKNTKMADILSVQVTVRLIESSGLRNRWGGNLIQPRALLTFL